MQAELIKFLSDRDNYYKYGKFIRDDVLAPEVASLIKVMGDMFTANPHCTAIDFMAAKPFFMLRMKGVKPAQLEALLDSIDKSDPDVYSVEDIIGSFIQMNYSNQIVDAIMAANGKPDTHVLKDLVLGMETALLGVTKSDSHIIDFDLSTLASTFIRSGGYPWRLDFLNRAVGPVGAGDLIVIGARPESGKTSFVTSEITHMMGYLKPDEDIIIFNNEEKGEKVLGRAVQSAIGWDSLRIAADPAAAEREYIKVAGRKNRIRVYQKGRMTTFDVERTIKSGKYKIVVFNVIAKVHGFREAGNETQRLEHLYQWARGIAIDHDCLVIVVAQADATAENQQYIWQDQLYNSKTAIQGEADVLITIGKLHGVEDKRFINIPKNKIPPTPGVDPLLSHGKEEVKFSGATGRYSS